MADIDDLDHSQLLNSNENTSKALTDAEKDYILSQIWEDPNFIPAIQEDIDEYENRGKTNSYSDIDVMRAHFRQYNSGYLVYKSYELGRLGTSEVDPNFDRQKALKERNVDDVDGFFDDVYNQKDFDTAFDFWEQDQFDKRILSDTSTTRNLTLGLVTGIADPVNWIPIGRALKFGTNTVRAGIEGAVIGGINTSVRSFTNKDITATEAAIDVVSSGLATGLFAASIDKTGQLYNKVKQSIKESLLPVVSRRIDPSTRTEVSTTFLGKIKHKIEDSIWLMIHNSPGIQGRNSNNELVQAITDEICIDRISTTNNLGSNIDISVEESVNILNGNEIRLTEKVDKYRNSFIKRGNTAEDFNKQVGLYIVNKESRKNIAPEVAKAAEEIKSYEYEIFEEAKKYGALNEFFEDSDLKVKNANVVVNEQIQNMSIEEFHSKLSTLIEENKNKVADEHILRKYNSQKIIENVKNVEETLYKSIKLNNPQLDDNAINDIVSRMLANISEKGIKKTGSHSNTLDKGRVVAVTDDVLLQNGMLDYDPATNHLDALKQLFISTKLNKVSQKYGFEDWNTLKEAVYKQEQKKVGELVRKKSESAADIASEYGQFNVQLLDDMEAILRGTFGKDNIWTNNRVLGMIASLRPIQCCMQLGNLFLASIVDTATPVFHFGFKRTVKNYALPKSEFRNMNRDTLLRFANFIDRAEFNNRYIINSNNIKFSDRINNLFNLEMKLSGQTFLDKALRKTVLEEIYHDVISNCLSNKPNMDLFKRIGITKKRALEIKNAFENFGYEEKGVLFVDPRYLSQETSDHLSAALRGVTDQVIFNSSINNVPRFLRKEVGSMLFMYKTYAFMLYNDLVRPIFSGSLKNKYVVEGIMASLALSSLRKYIVDTINQRETNPSSMDFWKDVITYSHLGNHIVDAVDVTVDVFNAKYGSSIGKISSTTSWIDNCISMIRDIAIPNKNIPWRRIRNNTPFINMWYMKLFTNPFIPKKSNKFRRR